MTLQVLESEFLKEWSQRKAAWYENAQLLALDSYLSEAFSSANKHAVELIPKHLFLLEKSASCLLLLARVVGERKMSAQRAAFLGQVHRAVNCLIAARYLLVNGLEETCRPVTRSYFEALDISLACLVDYKFSTLLFGDAQIDFDDLWKKEIGYGKVYGYVRTAWKLAGFTEEDAEEHIQARKEQKSILSASAHGDSSGAFRSMVQPLLGYPDVVSTEPHGVVSSHTPGHAATLITETYKYLVVVVKILTTEKVPTGFGLSCSRETFDSFFCSFFTFQEFYGRHELPSAEEIIAPDHEVDDG